MTVYLARKGFHYSPITIHKYMNQEMGLYAIVRPKKPEYIHGKPHKVFENKLAQNFTAERANQKWCTDFTVVVKLFCNICGLNLLDCCLEAIGTVRFYQWCFAPLRGHAIDQICHFRFFAITQSNQETCFRRPLCCCPHLVWCAVTVIAMWAHMIVGSIGEFLHRVIEFLFRPKFVQIRAFVL